MISNYQIILKLTLFSLFLIFNFYNFSQNISYNQTDDLTVCDLVYLDNLVEEQSNVDLLLTNKIAEQQYQVSLLQDKNDKITFSISKYLNLYENLLLMFHKINVVSHSTVIYLFSSTSFNQVYKRLNYLKLLSNYLYHLTNYIETLKKQQQVNLQTLQKSNVLLTTFLKNYKNNKLLLDSNVLLLNSQLTELQQTSNLLRIDLENLDYGYDTVKNLIYNFSRTVNDTTDEFRIYNSPLIDPIVISSFGVHTHDKIKDIRIKNDGVDLYSPTDSLVKVVCNGTVQAIVDLHKLGKSVIINHNNYFTVYSNLNNVFVSINNSVAIGQVLGTVSKNTSKYSFACLNFQVWNNNEKLNPQDLYEF